MLAWPGNKLQGIPTWKEKNSGSANLNHSDTEEYVQKYNIY